MIKARYLVPLREDIETPRLNFDEMLKGANEFAEKYRGLVVTEENVAVAKQSAAEMNDVRTQLSEMKTELRKRALAIVEPTLAEIDKILAVIDKPYEELKQSLDEVKRIFAERKRGWMNAEAERICSENFASVLAASDHLKKFVDAKCALRKGSWLTQGVTLSAITEELKAEAKRMKDEMDFIERHVKDKPVEVVRYAKVYLIEHGFDGKATLDATDRYEAAIEERRRLDEERKAQAMKDAQERLAARRAEPERSEEPQPPEPQEERKPKRFRFVLAVTGTNEQLRGLRNYIDENGLTFKKLEEPQEVIG
jgi:hypothetical protein